MSGLRYDNDGYVRVFVDGACFNNGQYNARAGYGVWFNKNHPLNTWGPVAGMPTNNNAEIQAATAAFRQAEQADIENLRVYTDSEFLINCMTKWIFKWQNNDWRVANGSPVKNKQSLIACFDALCDLRGDVDWAWVQGHNDNYGNNQADFLAKKGAQMYQ